MSAARFLRPAVIFGVAALAGLCAFAADSAPDPLAAGFVSPPADARPRTFWLWMNGNVTREGITLDLEAMHRVGVGGVMIFDGSDYLPAGPAGYLDPHWRSLMTHAIQEGNRLGIDIGMHNSPGWSSSGGPWVKPEMSMQQLSWTETAVTGGGRVERDLVRPHANEGFYRDAFVIAFPSLPAETVPYEQALARVSAGGVELPKTALSDGLFDTTVKLAPDAPLLFEFAEPVELQGLTVLPALKGRFPRLQIEASADGTVFAPLCTVSSPGRHGIVAPGARAFAPTTTRFVRVTPSGVGEIGDLVFHRAPRIADWVAKANFDYRVTGQLALPSAVPTAATVDPSSVIDLTAKLQGDRLVWDAPAGAWTILRIGHTSTSQTNVAASTAGRGLEIDKFNPAAAEFHFHHVIDQVAADAAAVGAKGPATITIDSYEAGMQNWTADFPAEFQRRAGYAITGWLPALFGRVVGDGARAERFLYDFRRVQADLMAENYYERMHRLAQDRGLRFFAEGYGSGNFDELRVAGLADVPMTEFWTRTPWTPNRVVKMVTSAAHIYGKPVVGAESFTGEFKTSRWLEYPYALKILGDEMAAQGVNLTVFHRYAHQPHPDAAPGMAMGPYGFPFDRTNTWFEQSRGWIDTVARTGFMLRQGTFAADVLYYTGERSPDPSQYAMPVLPAGFTYDLVNTDVLLKRLTVRDGAYELPEGARYRLLVLPPDLKAMRPALAAKLRDFVAAGGALLGPKPVFSPLLDDYPSSEREMLRIADELWATDRAGPGRVFATGTIGETLAALGATPDVTWHGEQPDADLSWQHRKLPDGDLFFLGNRQRRDESVVVSFRGMAGRQPELWSPETGTSRLAAVHTNDGDRALVPLVFEPAESVFVLFRHPAAPAPAPLRKDGRDLVTPALATAPAPDASGEFAMSIWVKPDTDLRVLPKESISGRIDEVGKFYAIPADPGDLRFGAGHATAGLAVGRNGIFVVERANDSCPAVLVADVKVSGWTHVAVVYRGGKPRLYVNGVFVREGLASGKIVHSGVGSPIPPVDYTLHFTGVESLTRSVGQPPPTSRGQVFYFEGNSIPPETIVGPVDDAAIAALAAKGPPAPALPVATALARRADGGAEALVWESGRYTLGDGPAALAIVPAPLALVGPWRVGFQAGRGAPESAELPELQSLHLNADPAVKYFSGTATYTHALDVSADYLAPGRRVVLDLGRVEVIADVVINGRHVAQAWKEPYRLDITDAVHAGANALEVRVATLWPNRLIGDEQLAPEDEFGIRDEQGNDPHGIVKLPDWYKTGKPKPPGGRVTFTTWRFYDKDEPLVASGLLGPVRLLNPVRVDLK
jgi:alpha-L-rhamnosidase/Concanavalin A-like lectin/glucanases superfamily